MKLASCLLALFLLATSASAQQAAINELFNSGGNDEWVEILVLTEGLDMRGWDLRDFTSGGSGQTPLDFTANALWSSLRRGTLIVVARPEVTVTEDTDPSDFLLVIKSNNGLYFSGNPFLFAGSSDAIQIRTAGDAHVFGVSWGASNQASLPDPKVHHASNVASNTSVSFNEDSEPELVQNAAWTFGSSTSTRGAGNSIANSAWLSTLRARADGSGSATMDPDTLSGGQSTGVTVTYRRDPAFSVTDVRLIIPAGFTWSRTPADVGFTGATATLSVVEDTVTLAGLAFQADSSVITVSNLTSPDRTGFYPFRVQSRQTAFADVGPTPRVVVFGFPEPIADVKPNDSIGVPLRLNELVTIRGIVTVANEFGGPSYLQDNSGGLGVFGSSFSTGVAIGDEVIVSGVIQPFSGLSEIVTPILQSILSSGNTIDPLVVTAAQVANDGAGGVELYEGQLIRLNGVTVVGTGTWQPNTNYVLFDATDSTQIRIDNNTAIVGTPVPAGPFDLVGVVGQFVTTPPYIGGYQILPRTTADIISTGPIIATFPVETNILPDGFTVTWQTLNLGSSQIRYGLTPALELGYAGTPNPATTHAVPVTGLQPATVYYVQAFSVAAGDTSRATTLIVCTASPAASTGRINTYFNKSIDPRVAWSDTALGNQNFVSRIITRINAAQRSIDAALYSLSGAPGDNIAAALVVAKNRGIRVRVIGEYDTRLSNAYETLQSNSVPIINDRFDALNAGAGLHHNKFFVIDGRGGAPESVWVWTGSWNPTDPGTNADYQSVVEVQDAALARAFTMEFEEMWGSGTETPNAAASRFGVRKSDNTPHRFLIGGRSVEAYFSPSDRVTAKIVAAVSGAQHSVAASLLTLTRSDIATAMVGRRNAGRDLRVLLDNGTDQSTQYPYLQSQGVDVLLKTGSGLLHHKYGLIDAENPGWNPVVITGSHNWTNAAETSNNENILFIHDGAIANLFLQEFTARYYQFGGTDSIFVGVEEEELPLANRLGQNYPNPFNPASTFEVHVAAQSAVRVVLFDVLGREVAVLLDGDLQPGAHRVRVNGSDLASGVYFYRVDMTPLAGGAPFRGVKKMVLMK
jgi:hypothetical protein